MSYYMPPNSEITKIQEELGFERLQAIRHLQCLNELQEHKRTEQPRSRFAFYSAQVDSTKTETE